MYYYFPTSRSWRLLDDRTITCVVGDPASRTAGTLERSRR
jgi:hypothetical protein